MARGRKATVEYMLMAAAFASGGLAVGLSADTRFLLAPILLGLACATATCVLGVRWSLLRWDQFDCGYRAGWADAAHEFTPYPAESSSRRVVPLRRR